MASGGYDHGGSQGERAQTPRRPREEKAIAATDVQQIRQTIIAATADIRRKMTEEVSDSVLRRRTGDPSRCQPICATLTGVRRLDRVCALAEGRTWTDSTGAYRIEADLVGFNDSTVVLKKDNRQLVAFPIAKLSQEDRAYLKSKDAVEQARRSADAVQTWTTASGLKVVGRVVDYARKDITIQQRRGKTYVNDQLFANLPEVYQKL